MPYASGVDVGSTQTKAAVVDETGGIVGRSLIDTGANVVQGGREGLRPSRSATPGWRTTRSVS